MNYSRSYAKINVIDIETFKDGFEIKPYCCIYYYEGRHHEFFGLECVEKMLASIFLNCKNNTIFYAHNLTFDGGFILNAASLPSFEILTKRSLLKNGDIYYFLLTYNKKSIHFKCSYKILPLSLKKIAEALKIDAKLEFDYDKVNINNYNDVIIQQEAIKYCRRDILISSIFMNNIDYIIRNLIPEWH